MSRSPEGVIGCEAVVWDWNGTLLDDVDACVASLATVMREAGLEPLTREQYRARFGWPIRDFYAGIGFPGDLFGAAAQRYVELFAGAVASAPLQANAIDVLDVLARRGLRQVLISATRHDLLAAQVAPHRIQERFEAMLGVDEALDPSKTHRVAHWLAASGLAPDRVVMVGDTNHDAEIAALLGTRFIRFSGGAQAPAAGTPGVVDDLRQVARLLA